MRCKKSRYLVLGLYLFFLGAYLFYGFQSADASVYSISAKLSIDSINLESNVTKLEIENGQIPTPEDIVGAYSTHENKILLIGHSTTVFKNLDEIRIGEEIEYESNIYSVTKIEVFEKSTINMKKILKKEDKKTLVIMTCAGELLEGSDATHRLIVTATINK